MLNLHKLWEEAARQSRQETRRQRHRIGRGRHTLDAVHRAAERGKDYGVGFCGGHQEIARRCGARVGLGPVSSFDPRARRETT